MADTTPPPADPLAAALAEYRERIAKRDALISSARMASAPVQEFNAAQDRLAEVTPRLLAAVEAVLALAAGSAEPAVDWGGVPLDPPVFVVRCDKIREAIAAELLGEDGSDTGTAAG